MSAHQEKFTRHSKRQRTQSEKLEQNSAVTGMLELSDYESLKIMINMLRALKDKVESMQEQMDNAGKGKEVLRIKKKC